MKRNENISEYDKEMRSGVFLTNADKLIITAGMSGVTEFTHKFTENWTGSTQIINVLDEL